ncbi:hypothetical protein MOV61_02835 [Neorhizobium sp. BETTINA12A]|uniref:hypothetical protein n=1 Tax=Neorhizobium sp. BETTINA12A TaxID=2908924 RepID=UPI001FF6D505|nr:hypothetical protein [Neorhizobium sp. BETTINA12A]MCJ9749652.1 hypothetical protein [Neorhizobium sp. BETTINA12A]
MHTSSSAPLTARSSKISLPPVSILGGAKPVAAVAYPKTKTGIAEGPTAKHILVGLDDQGKPHASWFAEEDGDAAAVAADLMDMALLDIAGDELTVIAAKLPRGKLFESGKAFVPFVKRSVYDQLARYFDEEFAASTAARVEAAQAAAAEGYAKASKGEVPPRQPEDWSKIVVGDLVLAEDAPSEGWFEAEVIEQAANDQFRLKWRDWPDLPNFSRGITDIALLHPKHVTA